MTDKISSTAQGLLFVMAGASGVGKGTLRERWLAGRDVFYSTSWTTRSPREGEVQDREYHFASAEEFENAVQNGVFLEHAEFVGNRYGTPIQPIFDALGRGQDVLLEIEVQGARQIRERLRGRAIMIFIAPPNLTELRRRLKERGTENAEQIEKRLRRAEEEMSSTEIFDHIVVNDDLAVAVQALSDIEAAERLRQRG